MEQMIPFGGYPNAYVQIENSTTPFITYLQLHEKDQI